MNSSPSTFFEAYVDDEDQCHQAKKEETSSEAPTIRERKEKRMVEF